MTDLIERLFEDADVVSTPSVCCTFGLSEPVGRAWAEELGVAKLGSSYAWTKANVEELVDGLDEEGEEGDGDDLNEDEEEDDDEDDE
jgi:hypothetical protein